MLVLGHESVPIVEMEMPNERDREQFVRDFFIFIICNKI